jgi:hypothetical protein
MLVTNSPLEASVMTWVLPTVLVLCTDQYRRQSHKDLLSSDPQNSRAKKAFPLLSSVSSLYQSLIFHFSQFPPSSTSHWLLIWESSTGIWITEMMLCMQYQVNITGSGHSAQLIRPPALSLHFPTWRFTIVKQNPLFRAHPAFSTRKWGQEYTERIPHSFSQGHNLWSQRRSSS